MAQALKINPNSSEDQSLDTDTGWQDLEVETNEDYQDMFDGISDGTEVLQNADDGQVTLQMIRDLEGKLSAARNLPNFAELKKILDEAEQSELQAESYDGFGQSETLQTRAQALRQKAQDDYGKVSQATMEVLDGQDTEEGGEVSTPFEVKAGKALYPNKNGTVSVEATFGEIKRHEITGPVVVHLKTDSKNIKIEIEKDQPEAEMRTIKVIRKGTKGEPSKTETFIIHEQATKIIVDGPLPDEEGKVTYEGVPYRSAIDPKITFVDEKRGPAFNYDSKKILDSIKAVSNNMEHGGGGAVAVFIAWDKAIQTGDWDPAGSALMNVEPKDAGGMLGSLILGLINAYGKDKAVQLLAATPLSFRKRLIQSAMSEMKNFTAALSAQGISMDLHYDPKTGKTDFNANRDSGPTTQTAANPNYLGPDQPMGDLATPSDIVMLINSTIPAGRNADPSADGQDDYEMSKAVPQPPAQK